MTYTKIWVSYCSKCKMEFGHIQKTRAMNEYKQHMKHWLDMPELELREIDKHYESMLMRPRQQKPEQVQPQPQLNKQNNNNES